MLADVGQIPAPPTCGSTTDPFTFVPPRPGYGYAGGDASLDTDAPPSRADRKRQRELDADALANAGHLDPQTDGTASLEVAFALTTGELVKRDDVEAAIWFRLAASEGSTQAPVHLGHRYHRGLGVAQDDTAAVYWFRQGAEKGDEVAMTALGRMYAAGRGVPQDWSAAVAWWIKAREWRFVGDAYACGLGVERDIERAVEYYKKGADHGDMSSTIQLAHAHTRGSLASPDLAFAFKSYKTAAERGDPDAQIEFSDFLLRGRAVPRDPMKAYYWAKLAELRLPTGPLHHAAKTRAQEAASYLTASEIDDTNAAVKSVIEISSNPDDR